jgi:hypothetical protein
MGSLRQIVLYRGDWDGRGLGSFSIFSVMTLGNRCLAARGSGWRLTTNTSRRPNGSQALGLLAAYVGWFAVTAEEVSAFRWRG